MSPTRPPKGLHYNAGCRQGISVVIMVAGEDVGNTFRAQAHKMGVENLGGKHHDDGIVPDVASTPCDISVRIEHDAKSFRIARCEPSGSRQARFGPFGIRTRYAELLAGNPPDEPGVTAQLFVKALACTAAAETPLCTLFYARALSLFEAPLHHPGSGRRSDL